MPTWKDLLQTGQHQHKGLSDDSWVGHASTQESLQSLSSLPWGGSLQRLGGGGRGSGGDTHVLLLCTKSATELVKPHVPIWGLQKAAVPIKPAYSQGFHTGETTLTSGPLGILIKSPCDRMTGVRGTGLKRRKWKPRNTHS